MRAMHTTAVSLLASALAASAQQASTHDFPAPLTWAYHLTFPSGQPDVFLTAFGSEAALVSNNGTLSGPLVNGSLSLVVTYGRSSRGQNATLSRQLVGNTSEGPFFIQESGIQLGDLTYTRQIWSVSDSSSIGNLTTSFVLCTGYLGAAAVTSSCWTVGNSTNSSSSADQGPALPTFTYEYSLTRGQGNTSTAYNIAGPSQVAAYSNLHYSGPSINATGLSALATGPISTTGQRDIRGTTVGVTDQGDAFAVETSDLTAAGKGAITAHSWSLPPNFTSYRLTSSFVLCANGGTPALGAQQAECYSLS